MTKPILNNQISYGNILQLGLLLVALVGGWFTVRQQSEVAASAATSNTAQIVALEGRIRSLETRSARDSEQLRTLQRDIGEIKDGQREINGLLRQILQRGRIDAR